MIPLAVLAASSLAAPSPALARPEGPDVAFRFADPKIIESSGLVLQDGLFVTMNDSGNPADLFAVDPLTGQTTSVTSWADSQTDAEALAPASGTEVWVGDIGDNTASRASISVTRVAVGDRGAAADTPTYTLTYPDQAHNAEALLADPTSGRLYIVTKGVLGGQVFAAPEELDDSGPNPLTEVGRTMGLVTDGAFFPDGRHIILRDYSRVAVYSFPDLQLVGELTLPAQSQGEGLAVAADGSIYVSSEGKKAPVYHVELPQYLLTAMHATASASPTPEPETDEPATESPSQPREINWVPVGIGGGVLLLAGLVLGLRERRRLH